MLYEKKEKKTEGGLQEGKNALRMEEIFLYKPFSEDNLPGTSRELVSHIGKEGNVLPGKPNNGEKKAL